ncbi:PREDICTED: immunoglobulin superfamily containing leucine-rich repeat protein-like [Tinamus guttatus]|uniref:immunoglobulin superfamily containing leucine-rich repeat protein-like n=1 Tax=Tinamus guttatus TaxID=94827 RepID=UPI00052E92A0|nr:PREDICTED: immunoglobulin superfamily containing leucine-rich repeat protein-like [Tinamus guttatus]
MPLWGSLLLTASLALEPAPEQDVAAASESCNCTGPIDFQDFQAAPLSETCCLNFTSSNITHLDWGTVAGVQGLRELYLSHCSITAISNAQVVTPTLEILHLSHNHLESLPGSFLEGAPNLKVLYLDRNQLQELPKSFLRASTQVQEVYLGFNALTFLPASLLQPSLLQLQLSNNSWDCSCALLSTLGSWPSLDVEVICHTPERYRGADLQSIPQNELCRSPSLTALFICLPLLLILASVACCFCRWKRTTNYSFQSRPESHLAMAETGTAAAPAEPHHYLPYELPAAPSDTEKKVLLGSQLLPQPSAALLESSKDLYEEVEIHVGSSSGALVPANAGRLGAEQDPPASPRAEELVGSAAEAETVSVSDVLRDSADREKMYMSQATNYYNLVPGIELEDSDNLEYENIDLH